MRIGIVLVKKTISIAAIIVAVLFITGIVNLKVIRNDGLDNWRRNPGEAKYAVTYQGQKYYGDHVETVAGYPDRLIIYRSSDYLLLPDKFAIEKAGKDETF